jgi:hypothetical protein
MRRLLIAGLSLAALSSVTLRADLVSLSFSGTFGGALGVVHSGDAFSGTAIWDDTTIGAHFPNFADVTSLTLALPPADGLSVASLPDAAVPFAGAHYPGAVFVNLQIDVKSSVDSNFYVFFIGATPGCPPNTCSASLTNVSFTQVDFASTFSVSGPTSVPEPATSVWMITGLGLVALFVRRSTS